MTKKMVIISSIMLVIVSMSVIVIIVALPIIQSFIDYNAVEEEVKSANRDEIQQFMGDMEKGIEKEITVARRFYGGRSSLASNAPEEPKGWVIYHLKSVYDEAAKESWIEVTPDLSRFKQSKDEPIDVITSRQQCGYISLKKDPEYIDDPGTFMLTECFHRWEYELK
ncbi:hypothetical protein [Metabacillus fastidiosus]|uniref:hypothetical protein n=1 Tax=Metabacillus fastidiosus TaxID=1458 RepID=UPI002E24D4F5|nr:hypothetical protein [Metabacillus fastidiosus]MED4462556.1 hypothetical protein [Metabacillus fastidiosus]